MCNFEHTHTHTILAIPKLWIIIAVQAGAVVQNRTVVGRVTCPKMMAYTWQEKLLTWIKEDTTHYRFNILYSTAQINLNGYLQCLHDTIFN